MNPTRRAAYILLLGPAFACPASAQYVAPQANPNRAAASAPTRTQAYAAGVAAGATQTYVAPPPAYYPGNYYTPYADPYGGYLNGVAAVTNANAQYQVTIQQARSAQAD